MQLSRISAFFALTMLSAAACGTPVSPNDDGGTGNDGSATNETGVATDGGAQPDGSSMGTDSGFDPFAAPPGCSTGRTWTFGNRGSDNMNPGQACIACHTTSRGAPSFSIAGTVYQTAREPNNCHGGAPSGGGPIVVEITDAMGVVQMIPVFPNSGNFYLEAPIATPYRARVLYNGTARAMATPQTNGDCNTCHGAMGSMGAPGRIVLP